MMRAVADPRFRCIQHFGLLGGPVHDFSGRNHVGEQGAMIGMLL